VYAALSPPSTRNVDGVDVGGVVAGQEQGGVGDLARVGEASHRHVHEAPPGRLEVLRVQLAQQRRVDRPRAERVDADVLLGELDAELTAQRQHAALGGGVGDLGRRRSHHRDEARGVDHGAAAGGLQVRDAVLAAQEDRAQVDRLDALPDVELGGDHRAVVGRRDAGVVEKDVDSPVRFAGVAVHRGDLLLVGDVGRQCEVDLLHVLQVDADHGRALLAKQPARRRADAARGARDDAHLALEPAHHRSVA
jgi:hypothetical protein